MLLNYRATGESFEFINHELDAVFIMLQNQQSRRTWDRRMPGTKEASDILERMLFLLIRCWGDNQIISVAAESNWCHWKADRTHSGTWDGHFFHSLLLMCRALNSLLRTDTRVLKLISAWPNVNFLFRSALIQVVSLVIASYSHLAASPPPLESRKLA